MINTTNDVRIEIGRGKDAVGIAAEEGFIVLTDCNYEVILVDREDVSALIEGLKAAMAVGTERDNIRTKVRIEIGRGKDAVGITPAKSFIVLTDGDGEVIAVNREDVYSLIEGLKAAMTVSVE